MKQFIIALLLALPLVASAQQEQNRMDPKYLAGAFIEENGKLTLHRELDVNGLTQAKIKEVVLDWTKEHFKGENDKVYELNDDGDHIMIQSKGRIRVKIGLFGSYVDMFYNVLFSYSDNKCSFVMRGMRYTKNPFEQKPETIVYAEQYLSDSYALTKDGTKVSYGIGTYRMSTIDYADNLAKSAQEFFDIRYKNLVSNRSVVATAAAEQPSQQTVASEPQKNAEKVASAEKKVATAAATTAGDASTVAATTAVAATAAAATTAAAVSATSTAAKTTAAAAATSAATAPTAAPAAAPAAQPAQPEAKPAEATQKVEQKTIVSAKVAEYIKNGGAAVTKVGGKALGSPVFGSAKYTKFGATEIIMYKNSENKDNINLLLEMSQNFEITVYEVVGGKTTSKVAAVLRCNKAESMDDFIVGEIIK